MTPERRGELNKTIAGWLYPNHNLRVGVGEVVHATRRVGYCYARVDYTDPAVMVQLIEKLWAGPWYGHIWKDARGYNCYTVNEQAGEDGLLYEGEADTLIEAVALTAEKVIDASKPVS